MKRPPLTACLLLVYACTPDVAPSVEDDAASGEAGTFDAGSDDANAQPEDAAEPDSGPDAISAAREPALGELMRDYRSWSPHPAMPQAISAQIASLCRLPSMAEEAFVESEHGDERLLQDWLNASAKQTFDSREVPFAVGAAIVKEKLAHDGSGELVLVARGLMIKREPGFDPAHGDWEFGYWEPAAGLAAGEETAGHCGRCHASAHTDFVFLDQGWRLP